MKILICKLLLSCSAVSPVIAGDSWAMLRDRMLFSGQFVIEEPDTTLIRDLFADDCCLSFNSQMHHVLYPSGPPDARDYVLLNAKSEISTN